MPVVSVHVNQRAERSPGLPPGGEVPMLANENPIVDDAPVWRERLFEINPLGGGPTMSVEERRVVATGGGRGIGQPCCDRLAANDGTNVAAVDLQGPEEVANPEPRAWSEIMAALWILAHLD